jgi:hypothetical protein
MKHDQQWVVASWPTPPLSARFHNGCSVKHMWCTPHDHSPLLGHSSPRLHGSGRSKGHLQGLTEHALAGSCAETNNGPGVGRSDFENAKTKSFFSYLFQSKYHNQVQTLTQ